MASYVSKYLGKHLACRRAGDKGRRMIRYSRGTNKFRQTISWATPGATLWRAKIGVVARCFGGSSEDWKIADKLGHRWAFRLKPLLMKMRAYEEPGRLPEFGDSEVLAVFSCVQDYRLKQERRQNKEDRSAARWGRKTVDLRTFRNLESFGEAFAHSWSERPVGQVLDLTCAEVPDELWEVRVEACRESLSGEGFTLRLRPLFKTKAPGVVFC